MNPRKKSGAPTSRIAAMPGVDVDRALGAHRAADRGDGRDPFGCAAAIVADDRPAERRTDEVRALDADRVHHREHVVRRTRLGVEGPGHHRVAVAPQVDRHDARGHRRARRRRRPRRSRVMLIPWTSTTGSAWLPVPSDPAAALRYAASGPTGPATSSVVRGSHSTFPAAGLVLGAVEVDHLPLVVLEPLPDLGAAGLLATPCPSRRSRRGGPRASRPRRRRRRRGRSACRTSPIVLLGVARDLAEERPTGGRCGRRRCSRSCSG